jgi:hypothetical protein
VSDNPFSSVPDMILYMSYWFKGTELPFRLATFYMANRLTDVVAPLMAFGLLRLRGLHGKEGWRWCVQPDFEYIVAERLMLNCS